MECVRFYSIFPYTFMFYTEISSKVCSLISQNKQTEIAEHSSMQEKVQIRCELYSRLTK